MKNNIKLFVLMFVAGILMEHTASADDGCPKGEYMPKGGLMCVKHGNKHDTFDQAVKSTFSLHPLSR